MNSKILDLGVQDPEARNSPVAWEIDEDTETLRESIPGDPVCFFNDQAYDHNTVIKSGCAATTVYGCPPDPATLRIPESRASKI